MDVESDFMPWLNGTRRHWVPDPDNQAKQRWNLDDDAWIVPPGHRILQIVGRMPKYHCRATAW